MYKAYYKLLGLPENASESDIRQAYRTLAKRFHPDVNKAEGAHERFIEITEAYEILIALQQRIYSGGVTTEEWKAKEYYKNEEYEQFKQEIRERAKQQARMRYEEFHKQNEVFKQTGFNDFVLVLKILGRIASLFICAILFILPVFLAITQEWLAILTLLFLWPFAGIIAWNIYDRRKNYFYPGEFYYNFNRIKALFEEKTDTKENCFYCSNLIGNSRPYKLELLKLKEIVIKTEGYRQHNISYVNEKKNVQIPRSKRAFVFHAIITLVKIFSILGCIIFLDFSSVVWRIIAGIALASVISSIASFILRIKSSTTYLYSYSFILRLILWIALVVFCSKFYSNPFNIKTTDYIYIIVFSIIIFDCVIMQGIDIVLKKYASKPMTKQYKEVEEQFKAGYKVYNDVPVFSFLFPIYRWIIG
jgi:curved DNA-binding protein CbpA